MSERETGRKIRGGALAGAAADAARRAAGDFAHPERILGPHPIVLDGRRGVVVRAFHADAVSVSLVPEESDPVPMQPVGVTTPLPWWST